MAIRSRVVVVPSKVEADESPDVGCTTVHIEY